MFRGHFDQTPSNREQPSKIEGYFDSMVHLLLEVVQVETEEVSQGGLVTHGELDPGGLHQLVPVAVLDRQSSHTAGINKPILSSKLLSAD